ncbi:uncharacterized protein LOC111326966 [Stylophora pistillata]|uniref:uncharacterized protein LOC111326966 n=1 Tax=Stylophora pistillata TaxID=50429 RepID=UPI000C03CDC1|nr:uncharacterized protein LOC111326966 [Stylophora pistillata]
MEANIVRIKCFRNELSHISSTGIANAAFEDKWNKIASSLEALEMSVQRKKHVEKMEALKNDPIDHDVRWRLEEQPKIWERVREQEKIDTTIFSPRSCLPDKISEENIFGRDKEIKQIKDMVVKGDPVVLITGGPGFGKTTVATAAAHEMVKTENDRIVLFCSLSSTKSLNEVATEMIHSCGAVQTNLPENPVQWLKNWSKQIQTQVTFVLDNADDILDSDDRTSFHNLMYSLRMLSEQKVTYVITTRKSFEDPKLQTNEVRLNPLSTEEAERILVSRVYDQNVRKRLCKTDEIVELCGCVPLALCVVGSLLLDYSEEKLIKNLKDQPFKVLEDDQLSVGKAIKTSFDLLTVDEQCALVLMSVFPGSFDSDAAEVIVEACASSETLPISILRSLKNRSLVEQPSSQRYQLHSLIKAFAKNVGRSASSLAKGEKVACAHYMSRLAENADCYWGKDTCKQSLDSFNEDRHNFEHFLQAFAQWR